MKQFNRNRRHTRKSEPAGEPPNDREAAEEALRPLIERGDKLPPDLMGSEDMLTYKEPKQMVDGQQSRYAEVRDFVVKVRERLNWPSRLNLRLMAEQEFGEPAVDECWTDVCNYLDDNKL